MSGHCQSKVCLAWGASNANGNVLGAFANGDYITGSVIRNHTGAVVGGLCRPKLAAVVPDGSSYTLGELTTDFDVGACSSSGPNPYPALGRDAFVARYDASRAYAWSIQLSGAGDETVQGLAANATGAWALVSTTGGIGTISGCDPGNCLIRIDPAGVVQWTRQVDATGRLEADGDAVWLSTGTTFVRHDDLGATEWSLPVSSLQIAPDGDLLTLENLAIPNADHVVNRRSKADPTVVLSSFVATPRKEVTLLQHRVDSKGRIAIAGTVYVSSPWQTPDVGGFALPKPDGNGVYSTAEGFITVFDGDGTKLHYYRLRTSETGSTSPVVLPESFAWSALGSLLVTGKIEGYASGALWGLPSGFNTGFPKPFVANVGADAPL